MLFCMKTVCQESELLLFWMTFVQAYKRSVNQQNRSRIRCCLKPAAVCYSWYRLKEFPIYTYKFSAGVLDISTVHSANNALGKFFVKFHISWSEIVLLLLTEYWFCLKAVMHWLTNEHTHTKSLYYKYYKKKIKTIKKDNRTSILDL